jgi:hypothetical protein
MVKIIRWRRLFTVAPVASFIVISTICGESRPIYGGVYIVGEHDEEVLFWLLGSYEPIIKKHKNKNQDFEKIGRQFSVYIRTFYVHSQVFGKKEHLFYMGGKMFSFTRNMCADIECPYVSTNIQKK